MTGSPLVIRCELAAPVAGPTPYVHLDGLLAWATVMLRGPRSNGAGHSSSDPLERCDLRFCLGAEDGVWAASALWPAEPAGRAETRWRMRPALEYSHLLAARQVPVAHGRTRARQETLPIWAARTWEARAHGRPREVRKLLRQVTAIGKKRSQGYGRVVAWHVEVDDAGVEWRGWDGIARRPIPDPSGIAQGVIPPYWYRPWWQPAVTPGDAWTG